MANICLNLSQKLSSLVYTMPRYIRILCIQCYKCVPVHAKSSAGQTTTTAGWEKKVWASTVFPAELCPTRPTICMAFINVFGPFFSFQASLIQHYSYSTQQLTFTTNELILYFRRPCHSGQTQLKVQPFIFNGVIILSKISFYLEYFE